MSIEINFERLEQLSIADLYALLKFYQVEHFETTDTQYELICQQICDVLANKIRERRIDIFIF